MLVAWCAGPVLAASNAPISEIFLHNPQISATAERVEFSYGLRVKGLVPLRDQLRDGAQVLFEGTLTLLERNLLRPNSELASLPLAWKLRHDPLTREFVMEDQNGAVRSSPFLDTLVRDMLGSLRAEFVPEDPLEADQTYLMKLSLILRYDKAPPWLRNAMIFWSSELSPALAFEQSVTLE